MTRTGRRIVWAAVAVAVLLAGGAILVVGGSYIDHRRLVATETKAHPAPGSRVRVDAGPSPGGPAPGAKGGLLHVYAEGEGDPTLVFLAGLGTSAPYFDCDLRRRVVIRHRDAPARRGEGAVVARDPALP